MKKIVAIILCLVFVLSLTACGKNDTAKTNIDTTEPTGSTAATVQTNAPEGEQTNTTASN